MEASKLGGLYSEWKQQCGNNGENNEENNEENNINEPKEAKEPKEHVLPEPLWYCFHCFSLFFIHVVVRVKVQPVLEVFMRVGSKTGPDHIRGTWDSPRITMGMSKLSLNDNKTLKTSFKKTKTNQPKPSSKPSVTKFSPVTHKPVVTKHKAVTKPKVTKPRVPIQKVQEITEETKDVSSSSSSSSLVSTPLPTNPTFFDHEDNEVCFFVFLFVMARFLNFLVLIRDHCYPLHTTKHSLRANHLCRLLSPRHLFLRLTF